MVEDKKPRIAIIDDSSLVLDSLSITLELFGWDVLAVNNRHGVAGHVARFLPDIILLDVKMPLLSGEDLVEILSEPFCAPQATILFHSNLEIEQLAEIHENSSAHGFIQKCDDPERLNRALRSYLEKD